MNSWGGSGKERSAKGSEKHKWRVRGSEFSKNLIFFILGFSSSLKNLKQKIQFSMKVSYGNWVTYIVGSRGSSQLGGSLLGSPLGYKAN